MAVDLEQEYAYEQDLRQRQFRASARSETIQQGAPAHKLDGVDLGLGIFVGLVFDLLSLIPGIGSVLGALGIGVLSLWLWIKGVPKLGTTAAITAIIELIPIVNWLPACIGLVVRAYLASRVKETPLGAIADKIPIK